MSTMRTRNGLSLQGRLPLLLLTLVLVVALSGCTSTAPEDEYDPWEGFNRSMWGFNMFFDEWVVEPAAQGWDWMIPEGGQRSVEKFFHNWAFPRRLVGGLLQAEFLHVGEDLGRFLVNTTVGFLGFFDPASDWGMEPNDEDVGQSLGAWGFGQGAYLVLPIFGQFAGRDACVAPIDMVLAPVSFVLRPIEVVNWRALNLELINENKATAFDFYAFVRNAHLKHRRALVEDRDPDDDDDEDEDIYDI